MTSPGSALPATAAPARVSRGALLAVTLALFLVWSNTFLAFEVLLAPREGPAPLGWLDLVVARFTPVFLLCGVWCFAFRRRESLAILRRFPLRLVLCGALAVPLYNGFLYYAMAHRVSGPIASVLTTLSPLWIVLLGVFWLGERLGWRQVAGLILGFAGVTLVATAKDGGDGSYGWNVALCAVAPLCWAVYTALTKPVMRDLSPLLWSYLVLVVGSLPLVVLLPFCGGPPMLALGAREWALVLYLSFFATIFGNGVWSWLLKHLPASTTGLTVFLNPPLTTASKTVLSVLFPAAFAFAISAQEWIGGGIALAGVALAVLSRRPTPPTPARRES